MTSLKLEPGLLPEIVNLPRSKSHANRALILSAVSKKNITLSHVPESTDVTFLVQALKKLGLSIHGKTDLTINGCFPECESSQGATIEVGEGGTTGRFLACLVALGSAPYTLILGSRLKERPWGEFLDLLTYLGARVELNDDRLTIQGPLKIKKKIEVDCARTTQFASGLQLALAFSSTEIVPVHLKTSTSYWEMTRLLIEQFKSSDHYTVPLDWSSASYPLAFGALKHSISFPGLAYDPSQADSKFYDLLKSLGAIDHSEGLIKVRPVTKAQNIKMDVSDCLDLVPSLAFFLSHLPGQHELHHIENLKHKESDRLFEVLSLLKIFNKKSRVEGPVLYIEGDSVIHTKAPELIFPDDHRMVMTGSLFLRLHGGGHVSPAEAVQKSFPDFFKLLQISWPSKI